MSIISSMLSRQRYLCYLLITYRQTQFFVSIVIITAKHMNKYGHSDIRIAVGYLHKDNKVTCNNDPHKQYTIKRYKFVAWLTVSSLHFSFFLFELCSQYNAGIHTIESPIKSLLNAYGILGLKHDSWILLAKMLQYMHNHCWLLAYIPFGHRNKIKAVIALNRLSN